MTAIINTSVSSLENLIEFLDKRSRESLISLVELSVAVFIIWDDGSNAVTNENTEFKKSSIGVLNVDNVPQPAI